MYLRARVCVCVCVRACVRAWVGVCVCVWVCALVTTFENSSFCIWGINRTLELKFSVRLIKHTRFLFSYHFRWNWFEGWDFMTNWIFWKKSVIALTAAHFKQWSYIVLYIYRQKQNIKGSNFIGFWNVREIDLIVSTLRNFCRLS